MEQIECFKNRSPYSRAESPSTKTWPSSSKTALPLHDQDVDPNATHPTSPPRPHDSEEEGMIEPEVEREEREREEREQGGEGAGEAAVDREGPGPDQPSEEGAGVLTAESEPE